jgi:epoxyqueuosine reductase QueG
MGEDNPTVLKNRLETQSKELGARFFGVADLTRARETVVEQGGEFLADYPVALSAGIALTDGIVDQLPNHKQIPVARTYDYLYGNVNRNLDRIAFRLSVLLNGSGFRTFLVPATQYADPETYRGLVSHKLAANLAGLGWIGPSCLLVTPEIGPRVRWVTVLTDAPLETGQPIDNQCGDCRQCVEACPPNAFTGRMFDPSEPRKARFNIRRCIDYRNHLKEETTGVRVCGMCVHICPFGRKEGSA